MNKYSTKSYTSIHTNVGLNLQNVKRETTIESVAQIAKVFNHEETITLTRNILKLLSDRHLEISSSFYGHPASLIEPNNEMYCHLLSDQTILIRKSDKSDSFQEL